MYFAFYLINIYIFFSKLVIHKYLKQGVCLCKWVWRKMYNEYLCVKI